MSSVSRFVSTCRQVCVSRLLEDGSNSSLVSSGGNLTANQVSVGQVSSHQRQDQMSLKSPFSLGPSDFHW